MSLEELKEQAERLTVEERHELSVFLVRLELSNDTEYWSNVKRRMNDKDPANWVNVRDLKA